MKKEESNIFIYFYLFFLLLQATQTLIPYSHGDALYYHLVGPKLWKESNWSSMWEDLSHYAQAGYFDLLYFVPTYFIESKLVNQIVCQFIHFFFSIFLGSLFVIYIIKDKVWGPICGIAILTIANDSSFFYYAKNDGALAFFSLLATYLVINKTYNHHPIIGGILIGIIPGIKINGFLIILPLILVLFYQLYKKETRFFTVCIVGLFSIITVLPQLVKNYIYTENPLFPGFVSLFPGNLTEPMLQHYGHFYGNPMNLEIFFKQIIDLITGKSIIILIPLLFFYFKKTSNQILTYFFIGLSVFLIYIIYNGSLLHPRYYFTSYFLIITAIFLFLSQQNINSKKLIISIFLLTIIDSKLDLSINGFYKIINSYYNLTEDKILEQYIPITKIWNKIDSSSDTEYVISDYISNSYYLPKNIRLHTAKQSLGADFLITCKDFRDIEKLKKYKYALVTNKNKNYCYEYITNRGKLIVNQDDHKLYKL